MNKPDKIEIGQVWKLEYVGTIYFCRVESIIGNVFKMPKIWTTNGILTDYTGRPDIISGSLDLHCLFTSEH